MTRSNIISATSWKEQYPLQAYQKMQGRVAEVRKLAESEGRKPVTVKLTREEEKVAKRVAFYFIVNIQEDEKCLASIKNISIEKLTYTDKKFHFFTPLHVAVLLDKVKVVRHLLDKGCSLQAKDENGFTAVLLSAFVGGDIYKEISLRVRPESHRSPHHANLLQLRELLTTQGNTTGIEALSWVNNEGQRVPMNSEKYLEITHRQYTGTYLIRDQCFIWKPSYKGFPTRLCLLDVHTVLMTQAYKEFKERPPKLVVKPTEWNEESNENLGLFAGRKITEGTIVREYTGEAEPTQYFSNEEILHQIQSGNINAYQLSVVNAKDYGGGAELINDGFPTSIYASVKDEAGIYSRSTVIMLCDVEDGEELFVNYGQNFIQVKNAIIYKMDPSNRERMHRFFKASSLESIFSELENPSTPEYLLEEVITSPEFSKKAFYRNLHVQEALRYILSTPSALFDLIISDVLDAEALLKLVRSSKYKDIASWDSCFGFLVDIACLMRQVKECSEQDQCEIKKTLLQISREVKTFQWRELIFLMSHSKMPWKRDYNDFIKVFKFYKPLLLELTLDMPSLSWQRTIII
ncbi:MAG: SET domain-containing protein-lysine N-methyltransferase [Parachlamydiales bacterium]|jgi:hypothetical protein